MFHKRYCKSRLTAFQWSVVGWCMNWESLSTENARLGHVKERCWRLPTIVRYSIRSKSDVPVWRSSVGAVTSGVMTVLALVMWVQARRSLMYHRWDKRSSCWCGMTSTPRRKERGPRSFKENRWARRGIKCCKTLSLTLVIIMSST